MVGGGVVLQAEVAAKGVDLQLGDGAGVAEADLVHAAQHGDRGVLADGLQVFHVVGVALHVGVRAVTVRAHPLVAGDGGGPGQRRHQARVDLKVIELRVPAAVAQGGHEGHFRAGILGGKGQRAAEGCDADVAGRAGAALHDHLADQLGREITGGVVAVGIVVAKRNPVEGHVVAAVIDAADRRVLGLAEAGSVRLHVRDARGDVHDRRIVGGRDHVVGNVLQRQDGRGQAGAQFAVGGGGREGGAPGGGDFKFLQAQDRVTGRAED